jgi:chemotaxis protein CheC
VRPTEKQIEALKEIINIGVGRSAGVLNTMLNSHITLNVPYIKLLNPKSLRGEMGKYHEGIVATVQMGFGGSLVGNACLAFPKVSASKLVASLTGEELESSDADAIQTGTLNEIGNIVLNGVIGSISNMLQLSLNYKIPIYMEGDIGSIIDSIERNVDGAVDSGGDQSDLAILLARTRFAIEALATEGDIILFFEVGSFESLISAIDGIGVDGTWS